MGTSITWGHGFRGYGVEGDMGGEDLYLRTCTHEFSAKYTAVRTHGYIQQTHSACTDEALVRVYR